MLQATLDHALRGGGDFAEVFVEDRRSSSGRFDDGRVEELVSGRDRGAGLRVVRGDTTGFAHTADLSPEGLLRGAATRPPPRRGGGGGGAQVVALGQQRDAPGRRDDRAAPETVEKAPQGRAARPRRRGRAREGGAITSVTASYADARRRILVANSDGLLADDDQVRTRIVVQCVATGDTGMQTGYEAPGRTMGFELFDEIAPGGGRPDRGHARADAARRGARAAGKIPVVLEARRRRRALPRGVRPRPRGRSHSQGRVGVHGPVGELVASPLVTLVDDGTYGREWGTLAIDDEGHPAQRNVLIERRRAHRLHVGPRAGPQGGARASSGNGRRETYRTCRCCA